MRQNSLNSIFKTVLLLHQVCASGKNTQMCQSLWFRVIIIIIYNIERHIILSRDGAIMIIVLEQWAYTGQASVGKIHTIWAWSKLWYHNITLFIVSQYLKVFWLTFSLKSFQIFFPHFQLMHAIRLLVYLFQKKTNSAAWKFSRHHYCNVLIGI